MFAIVPAWLEGGTIVFYWRDVNLAARRSVANAHPFSVRFGVIGVFAPVCIS